MDDRDHHSRAAPLMRALLMRPAAVLCVALAVACSSDITDPGEGGRPPFAPVVNGVRTAGTTTLLVVPALFSDSPPSLYSSSELQRRLFDGPSSVGTMTEFYREQSRNRFTLRGTVTPWVRTNVGSRQSGPGSEGFSPLQDHIIQALRAVDASINFGLFDNDGPDGRPNSGDDDGVVDGGVMILTAERGRHCGPDGPVWPHYSQLRQRTVADSIFRVADRTPNGQQIAVRSYVVTPATSCTSGTATGIAIPSHEAMHLLFRVPDMYGLGATSERTAGGARLWRTGCWDLMAAGSGWGCGTGPVADVLAPNHPNPWIKETVHWLQSDTIRAANDSLVTLRAVAAGGGSLRFIIAPGEWYEVEYRQRVGFDSGIPASGVLIYHVHTSRPVTPPTCLFGCTQPPLLVEADNNAALLTPTDAGGNRGEAGDAFGLFGRTEFSATTTPAARAADGSPTRLRIHGIVIDEAARVARMRVTF